jgi:ATP-dependent Clp protease adaptor protein ClpS
MAQARESETTVTPETQRAAAPRLLPLYRVLLHNDDVNTMDHVVRALRRVFGFPAVRAVAVMLEAHETGVALCAVEPLERAELHRDQLRSYSLIATIEAEE